MHSPLSFRPRNGVISFLIFLFFVSVLLALPVGSQQITYSMGNGSVKEAGEALYDGLPQELREALSSLESENGGAGQAFSFSQWAKRIFFGVKDSFGGLLSSFTPLFSLILLIGAGRGLIGDGSPMHGAFTAFAGLFASVEVFRMTASLVTVVQSYLTDLCRIMNLFLPVMEAVCLLGGKVTEQAVTSGGLLLFITLITNLNTFLLSPLVTLLFTLSAVTMTCPEVRLGGLVMGLRKGIGRIWTFLGITFSFLLGIQTVLAKSADSLGSRTARFALGTFVPVAGGFLSEAYSTVTEGLGYVRQTAGAGGILLILLLLLPGIVPLLLHKLALALSASMAEMLGEEPLRALLSEMGGIVDLLMGVVLVTGLFFLLAVILFMKSQGG